jgi:L-alanine-DL-glutamate epimerase-like enolase superfamily enzyme
MKLSMLRVDRPLKSEFRIAYSVKTKAETLLVELCDESGSTGRGEALGIPYHGETADSIYAQLAGIRDIIEGGMSRADLGTLLPAGGARNAVDCALWDLEAKREGRRAWQLAGIEEATPLMTTYTLSLDTPKAMATAASVERQRTLLKLKLGSNGDMERVAAVRQARPDAVLLIDANQAWTHDELFVYLPTLVDLGVQLIEQPLAVGHDGALAGFSSPIPLCADESCQTTESLKELVGKYSYANIKLDKCGGLTEGLTLAHAATDIGLKLMIGCMGGSSISMAPAFIVGQLCEFVDLDGPLLLASDVPNAITYEGSKMFAPDPELWG